MYNSPIISWAKTFDERKEKHRKSIKARPYSSYSLRELQAALKLDPTNQAIIKALTNVA